MQQEQRYLGCLLGLACGDAVGTTVEFQPRGGFAPLTDMVGGGVFGLPPGAWTDDTSMALCLAESLLARDGFDAADQMDRYLRWWRHGHLSSTGECFDIGGATRMALSRYEKTGEPFSGNPDPHFSGNGSLMRVAPVPMFYQGHPELARYAADSARTTHASPEAIETTQLLAAQLSVALAGGSKQAIVFEHGFTAQEAKVAELAQGHWQGKDELQIRGSGYAVESLEAALWCFWRADSFEEAVLMAANLGQDADTTAAICGQLAGAHWGVEAIPAHWRRRLVHGELIAKMARALWQSATAIR
ncbi:ADP-ribosylglycohydrolase family protein [Crenobacter intestini]|uniref:ADP-ribosylglycohydrolase family protein n=1 Tax=Crenobacter intestini TaxID=2563443 RepID=A0A4T0UNM6_9NEIS|nr:ADP-ribosylglycohydrolase family protein [Crenobacter intestini]TIC80318.1 ADP-ribosylglycohydrolase family protein [Crenobacter intestini]